MLSKVLFVCLFALSASNQEFILHTTDFGVGRSVSYNDKVLGLYGQNLAQGEDIAHFMYDKGGSPTFILCHDRDCESHTETLVHAGGCGGGSCPFDICTPSGNGDAMFVYSSSVDGKTYAVSCHGDDCVGKTVTEVFNAYSGEVSCAAYTHGIFVSMATTVGTHVLVGCDRPCTTPFGYFTAVFPFDAYATAVVARGSGIPLMVMLSRVYFETIQGQLTPLYTLFLINCKDSGCRYPVSVVIDKNFVQNHFAVRLRKASNALDEYVQVLYVYLENGVFDLKLFTCRPGYIPRCRDRDTIVLASSANSFFGFSMSYKADQNLLIHYIHEGAVREIDCLDLYCNNGNSRIIAQGSTYGSTSVVVNPVRGDRYMLRMEGGRIKLYTEICKIPTLHPTLSPTPAPTGTPSGTTFVPTGKPSVPSEEPTKRPTGKPTVTPTTGQPTETPTTGMPTGTPTGSPVIDFEARAAREAARLRSRNIAWMVVNSFLSLLVVYLVVRSYVVEYRARAASNPENAIVGID